jgi:glycosyltransferase involved in cell wall biosynthesis
MTTGAIQICMFSNLFPPIVSGSSTFTWELSKRLAAEGHKITVVTARIDGTTAYEEKDGISVHRLSAVHLPRLSLAHNFKWLTFTYMPQNLRRIDALFRKTPFDIIHQQNHVFDTILSSARFSTKYDLPLVLTNPLFDRILTVLDGIARRVVFEKAGAVVSPDPVVQKYVRVRHRIMDSPVIPYGIEASPSDEKHVSDLKKSFHVGDEKIILSLGHVHGLRDRLDLIGAMPYVLQQFPSTRLIIVGEVQIQQPLELVKKLALEKSIVFAGPMPHSQIPSLFALSALEAHTFNGPYPGPGIASMEAMAAGLPVVTGEIDAEYDFSHFRNWENVVMVPKQRPRAMAEAIIRLLSDDDLRHRIGVNAKRLMADRFSWDAVAEAYVDLYRRAIELRQRVQG